MPTQIINYNATATGSPTTLLSTELNSLATATNSSAGSALNNFPSTNSNGYTEHLVELNLNTWGTAPVANSAFYLYALPTGDGTNYGDVSNVSAELVGVFPLQNSTAAQRVFRRIQLPPYSCKFFGRHDAGSGMNASSNTVKAWGYNYQVN